MDIQQAYDNLQWIKREDGTEIVVSKDVHGKNFDDLMSLTFKVSEGTSLSIDSVYRFTKEALGTLLDNDNNIELARESLEADIYTSDLTDWLNESNYHVEYLTRAIEDFSPKDGFEVLSLAQYIAKTEVLDIVIEFFKIEG